jgi:hypothetical protein
VQPQPVAAAPVAVPTPQPKLKKKPNPILGFLKRKWWLVLIALVLAGTAGYFGYKYYTERGKPSVQGAQNTKHEATTPKELVDEISQFIVLPNEEPQVATISNIDLLKGQDFFKNAQNGDAVLIYTKAGRGLLYRPSTHKIIEYTKVTFNGNLNQ